MSQHIRNISSVEEYNALVSQTETPVVIDFWAPWCGPCQALGPILEGAATKLGEDAIIAKVNVDTFRELARENGITSIPTLFYYAGGELQHRENGISQEVVIVDRVRSLSTPA